MFAAQQPTATPGFGGTEPLPSLAQVMSGGTPSAIGKDDPIGTSASGIVRNIEAQQQHDIDTGAPKFFDNGQPMMQIVVHIATDQRDPMIPGDDGMRAVDPPQTRVAFGVCPFCRNGVVWGTPRSHMDVCRSCGAEVNRTYVADRLLDRLARSEKKGTPKQMSGECAKAGIRLPAATIRTWIHRKRLTPDMNGHVTLRDIVPLLRDRAR
ncbi:PhnA protein [Bifidobacterium margollesii]|uniref:PhnA protein n=1 Tax=Bifidobacterium margollesii TaxID=2020964 RepID=A0A2N5J9I3_9BIFI|nr:hypothetical protein [Bifidobacterium margollesii]PLS30866.1 PhnA protein [Bifidobacterium margollesii]